MNYLEIAKLTQIFFSVLLIALTLIQSKGTGLAQSLKGSFGAYRSLRGVEKIVFILTIVITALFVANSVVIVVLN